MRAKPLIYALPLVLALSQATSGSDVKLRSGSGARTSIELKSGGRTLQLETQAPSFGPPPRGFIYGGPYPPPYPFYPYPYYPYPSSPPWPPPDYPYPSSPPGLPPAQGFYAPPPSQGLYMPPPSYGDQLIPAGWLDVLADPVTAEVSVDGLRLRQRSDLSYKVTLLEGKHLVEVRAQGYEPYRKEIDIPGGQSIFLTIRLPRVLKEGKAAP